MYKGIAELKNQHSSPEQTAAWDERLRTTVGRYEAGLLRHVGERLVRLPTRRPLPEIVDKITEAVSNPVVLDRRLKEQSAAARTLLGLIGLSQRPSWPLRGVLLLLAGCSSDDGMPVVLELFEAGLLYPELREGRGKLKTFGEWLVQSTGSNFLIFTHPNIAARALVQWSASSQDHEYEPNEPFSSLGIDAVVPVKEQREADGLEWFLRLGALWQEARTASFRLTQQGEFFKRDQDRLKGSGLLDAAATDELASLPALGGLLASLAGQEGVLQLADGELSAGDFPASWGDGLVAGLRGLWAATCGVENWDPLRGWRGWNACFPGLGSAAVLTAALLARLPEDEWATVDSVTAWLGRRHRQELGLPPPANFEFASSDEDPTSIEAGDRWREWVRRLLLGLAYQLRLIQAARAMDDRWVVRLSPTGRAVLGLEAPPAVTPLHKTLLVQPNLEMIVYRQGLTPQLTAQLSRFATWKQLGSACIAQLDSASVYRGLESGLTWEKLVQTLQRHCIRELPPGVLQTLRTWTDKRERLTVYAAATLLEFHSTGDLQAALSRGLPAVTISDRMALALDESAIEFREYRLLGSRDFGLPPGRCVEVGADGVTLAVDVGRADLLLEPELQRFAQPMTNGSSDSRRTYVLTPESLRRARAAGFGSHNLEEWFQQRTGQEMPAAARLLLGESATAPLIARTQIVIQTPSAAVADGLMQWPETRKLIHSRLGPQALVVARPNLEEFEAVIRTLGIRVQEED